MPVQSCCFALSSYCFFTFSSPLHLKLSIIYDTLWSVRNRIFSVQNELFLLIASETFFDSSVVPSFLVRKVENESFPCTHKLGKRSGQLWRDNSHRVRTHEKNSGDAVRRLDTIIQSIFWAQSGASIHLTIWKWLGESWYPGALPPVLENFHWLPLGLRGCKPPFQAYSDKTNMQWQKQHAHLAHSNYCRSLIDRFWFDRKCIYLYRITVTPCKGIRNLENFPLGIWNKGQVL